MFFVNKICVFALFLIHYFLLNSIHKHNYYDYYLL